MLTENRVAVALPSLPTEVQQTGVVVRKASPDFLMAVHFYSPDNSFDQQYISNYFTLHVRDEMLRLPGVGDLGGGRRATTRCASGSTRTRPPSAT